MANLLQARRGRRAAVAARGGARRRAAGRARALQLRRPTPASRPAPRTAPLRPSKPRGPLSNAAPPPSPPNPAQEVGGNHGVALWGRADSGFASMPGMDHLIFVATRMQIRMEAYPKWCAAVLGGRGGAAGGGAKGLQHGERARDGGAAARARFGPSAPRTRQALGAARARPPPRPAAGPPPASTRPSPLPSQTNNPKGRPGPAGDVLCGGRAAVHAAGLAHHRRRHGGLPRRGDQVRRGAGALEGGAAPAARGRRSDGRRRPAGAGGLAGRRHPCSGARSHNTHTRTLFNEPAAPRPLPARAAAARG
jgi:hypothetical protein